MDFFEKEINIFLDGYSHEYAILDVISKHVTFDIIILSLSAHFFYAGKMIAGSIIIMAVILDAIFMQKLLIKIRRKMGYKYYGTKYGNYLNFMSIYENLRLMSTDEINTNAAFAGFYLTMILANIVIIICAPFNLQPNHEFVFFAVMTSFMSFFWWNFNTDIENIINREKDKSYEKF